MNRRNVPFPTFLFCIILFLCSSKASGHVYHDNGSNITYNLFTNDTLYIESGTYKGEIKTFNPGAVIYIRPDATLEPSDIRNARGKIINFGVVHLNWNFSPNADFEIENRSIFRVKGDCNLTSNQKWFNYFGGSINIERSFTVNASYFMNAGTIHVANNLTINVASTFINRNKIFVNGHFAANNNSSFSNLGMLEAKGNMSFNVGSQYQNNCYLITENNFYNNGGFENKGLIQIKNSGEFSNSGNFIFTGKSALSTTSFRNYNEIKGNGAIYIHGNSQNYGKVGIIEPASDSIYVFDVTKTNPTKIFDVDWGNVHPNAVFRNLTEPQIKDHATGCAAEYISNIPLSVKLLSFTVVIDNKIPKLNWNSSSPEKSRFIIERSYDNRKFEVINQVESNSNGNYIWKDEKIDWLQNTVFYRIKAVSNTNEVTYSETRKISLTREKPEAFPNPFSQRLFIMLPLSIEGDITISLYDINGKLSLKKQFKANTGSGSIELKELQKLLPGIYVLDIRNGNESILIEKIIKQ